MEKKELLKKAENIVAPIKTLPFQTLCHYLYVIREQKDLVSAIAEFVGVKGETDRQVIANAIVEYGKKVKAEEEKKKLAELQGAEVA